MQKSIETPDEALGGIVHFIKQSREREAMEMAAQSVHLFPDNARLRFLFGSLLAGQRQYDQALQELSAAVQLDPAYEIARFQLGSLRLTGGDAAGAREAWALLADLADDHPLKCFKNGLEAIIEDRFEECVGWLENGILLNSTNPYLNRDMQLVIDRASAQIRINQANSSQPDGTTHLLIGGYQQPAPESGDNANPDDEHLRVTKQ